jgi:thymidine kinase
MNKRLFLLLTANLTFLNRGFSMDNTEINCFDDKACLSIIKQIFNKTKGLKNLKFTTSSEIISLIDYTHNPNIQNSEAIENALTNKAILLCLGIGLNTKIESEDTKKDSSLKLTIGAMFSGKTNEMIKNIKKAAENKRPHVVFASSLDTNGSIIKSHDNIEQEVTTIDFGGIESMFLPFPEQTKLGIEKITEESKEKKEIYINETQFFPSPIVNIIEKLEGEGKKIHANGLSKSFEGFPFFIATALLTIMRGVEITEKRGECASCKTPDSTEFSMRKSKNIEELEVGDGYIPVCENCFIYPLTEDQFIEKFNTYKKTFKEHMKELKKKMIN